LAEVRWSALGSGIVLVEDAHLEGVCRRRQSVLLRPPLLGPVLDDAAAEVHRERAVRVEDPALKTGVVPLTMKVPPSALKVPLVGTHTSLQSADGSRHVAVLSSTS
jgi:hypothetical protein